MVEKKPTLSAYVEDIMSKNMIKMNTDSTVLEVAKTLAKRNVSSVLLEDSGKIIGILTERDLVRNVCARDLLASKTPASAIMSTPLVTVNKNALVQTSADLMIKNKVRHLAIEDNYHNIIGIITTTDLARHLREKNPATASEPTILEAIYAYEEPYRAFE
jgi:signal-transduction protein with cAMP-binding, CBS, and nucleotidyltransferase domain